MIGFLQQMLGKMNEEQQFRQWYGPMARHLGIDQNPDAPEHHYDNRAFYRAMRAGQAVSPDKPGGHFPSTFKTEGHPRTFLDDGTGRVFDTRTATYLDGSPVPDDRLRASEQSPDMPGFRPPPPRLVPADFPVLPRQGIGPQGAGQPPMSFRPPGDVGPAPPAATGQLSMMTRKGY